MRKALKFHFITPLFFQKLIWVPTRLVLILFGRHKVHGLENLRGIHGPVLFACNHSSEIDPFMAPASLPFLSRFSPLFYIVREKEFYTKNGWRRHLFNAWFIKLWGGHGAQTGLRDYELSLAQQVSILKEGGSFCIFPEGGITKDGHTQPAKGGISFLAHSAPCTIVPVGISHVYDMSVSDFFLQKRQISVRFGLPIKPDELYSHIGVHEAGKSVWKEESEYILKKVAELIEK